MKEFFKKYWYIIGTLVSSFIFVSTVTFTTGFRINDWQWWCIVMSPIPYILTEYCKGLHDGHKIIVSIIKKVVREQCGDDSDISVR